MKTAHYLGGTTGLGHALAFEGLMRGINGIVYGRTKPLKKNEVLQYKFLDFTQESSVVKEAISSSECDYLFWVAGAYLRKKHSDLIDNEINGMIDLHLRGPLSFLRHFLKARKNPLHLIVIASCSSWKNRRSEALYCCLKAAQAAFARNLYPELSEILPGSRVTLINPGGLNVPTFWKDTLIDTTLMLDPNLVSKIIWNEVSNQSTGFLEIQILREVKAEYVTPLIKYGPIAPEIPI